MSGDKALAREERSRRGLVAATAVARGHGLTVGEPVVLNDLFSLMVWLRPAPVVARVATCMPKLRDPIGESLGVEIAVTTYLAERGAPVVRPSAELPAGPHEWDGLAISFWTHLERDPDRTVTARDCSAMLVDLHDDLREYPGAVPAFAVRDIERGLEVLDQVDGVVSTEEAGLLHRVAERLAPFMAEPPGRVQVLHGDAHPGNVVATRNGLVWIDFEDVCRGPVEWDLASMMDTAAIGEQHRPDPEILARCKELRTLQVVLALVAFHEEFGDLEGWDESIRGMLGELA